MATAEPIVIYRRATYRYSGITAAAAKLGVSISAVSKVASGVYAGALSAEKRARLKIVDLKPKKGK